MDSAAQQIYEFSLNDDAYVPQFYDSGLRWHSATALFCRDRLCSATETVNSQEGNVWRFMCGKKYGYTSKHVERQLIEELEETITEQMNQACSDMKLTIYVSYSPCAFDQAGWRPNCRGELIDFVNRININRTYNFKLDIVFSAFHYVPLFYRNNHALELNTRPQLQAGIEGLFELQNHEHIHIRVITETDWHNLFLLINEWNRVEDGVHTCGETTMEKQYVEDDKLRKDLWMLLAKMYCHTIIAECGLHFPEIKAVVEQFKNFLNDYKFRRMLELNKFVDRLSSLTEVLGTQIQVVQYCCRFTDFLIDTCNN